MNFMMQFNYKSFLTKKVIFIENKVTFIEDDRNFECNQTKQKQSREKRMFPKQIIAQEAKQGLMLVLSLGHQIFKG